MVMQCGCNGGVLGGYEDERCAQVDIRPDTMVGT